MKAIRAIEKSPGLESLNLELAEIARPKINSDQCLIEIHGSGINPSDVKGFLGVMPNLVWPRTPGRDYAGIVVEGPNHLLGKEVWGGGSGILGMAQDGAHAELMVVNTDSVREKPKNLSLLEASGIGVPFSCGYMGLIEGAGVQKGDRVAVLGANGKVGQAVIQLATMLGAHAMGVERQGNKYHGHSNSPVKIIDASKEDVYQGIMSWSNNQGADIIFNTVGSPYFDQANQSLAKKGRQIIIATIEKEIKFNLLQFYRGNHRLIGVSNMDLNTVESAKILDQLKSGFESKGLRPFPVKDETTFGLKNAEEAYKLVVDGSTKDRIFINPQI